MSSFAIALIALACMVVGMLVGIVIRYSLPDHHIKDDSKDVMKTAAGMMATLVALIIGLLVSSAKNSFDTVNSTITQGGAKMITLNHILSRYGSEADGIRKDLYGAIAAGSERIWPTDGKKGPDMAGAEKATGLQDIYDKIRDLKAKDESQQYLKSQALQLSADLMHSRWMMIEQSQNNLPLLFLIVLISWLTVLFTGFGLLTPRNITAISALFVCAISMAGAVFLILELNHPLEGAIRVSNAPLLKALQVIGK